MLGSFLETPGHLRDLSADEVRDSLRITTYSGHRADLTPWVHRHPLVARAHAAMHHDDGGEDQCSPKYYADLLACVQAAVDETGLTRLVEIGVYQGACSVLLAVAAAEFDLELDLIDVAANYLRCSWARIHRVLPEVAERTRLWHGDVASYVAAQRPDLAPGSRWFVEHDGSHDVTQVIVDLAGLSYVRDSVTGIAIQDTHLRGRPPYLNFVDVAVLAVFGHYPAAVPIGTSYDESAPHMLEPNQYQGNYFLAGRPEGLYLPMSENHFEYPHPAIPLEAFLPSA